MKRLTMSDVERAYDSWVELPQGSMEAIDVFRAGVLYGVNAAVQRADSLGEWGVADHLIELTEEI